MNKLLFPVIVLLIASCKQEFISPAPSIYTGYLVVEGVINNGGKTSILLSRTNSLRDTVKKYERGAKMQLEDNHNNTISFLENSNGSYSITTLQLDTSLRYRLHIKTSNNEVYQSDFVGINYNPPIDSINWVRDNNGVQLFINTNNPQNNTRYYQWQYNETWEFHSAFTASLKWVATPAANNALTLSVEYRDTLDPVINTCFQFNASNTIILGSSAKLSQDIIHLPLTQIPAASWKLSVMYSILVKQYAWSKEGYNFMERMKKNTESVGSVFDAQPSELNSNIHCTSNSNLPVIGYFNICTITERRIFIKNNLLPGWNYQTNCTNETIPNIRDTIKESAVRNLPVNPVLLDELANIVTFSVATPVCVDCTLTGSNIKPSYWP